MEIYQFYINQIFYDTPAFFDIGEITNTVNNLKNETYNASNSAKYMIDGGSYTLLAERKTNDSLGIELNEENRILKYFKKNGSFILQNCKTLQKAIIMMGLLIKLLPD